jgi:lipopolysaccharide transport system permease protein
VLSNIYRLGIQFGLLFAAMIWYNFHGFPVQISFLWLFIPLLVIVMAGIGLGLGIIVSSLTTKYRDFTILMTFIVQLLLYVTPIGYPISYLAHSKYKFIIDLNPLSSLVEAFRYVLFHKGSIQTGGIIYSIIFMFSSLLIGLFIFSKVERSFMDTV